jgi:hypothetical protein
MYIEPIWIHPELGSGGYSAVKVYECADFDVSLGSVAAASHPHYGEHVVIFSFSFAHVQVVGGEAEWVDWKKFTTDEERQEFAYRLLFLNLDAARFRLILADANERGIRDGRNSLRESLDELLTKEY